MNWCTARPTADTTVAAAARSSTGWMERQRPAPVDGIWKANCSWFSLPTMKAGMRNSDLAWRIGAAFAPLVALGLCANFGLAWLGAYLLSGALGTLVALGINRAMNYKS